MASLFPQTSPPLINFHCGSLGFLMPFDLSQYREVISSCVEGKQQLLERSRLEYAVCKSSAWPEIASSKSLSWFPLLNDVVVKRQHTLTGIASVDCYIDKEHLACFKGDGIIVSSPTGSSAYSMAAQGSIVHPGIDAILLTPLNSMSLASRPLILPGGCTIRLHVLTDSVVLEGKYGRVVEKENIVIIRQSKNPLLCFTRDDATSDWVRDLKYRLLYQRKIRNVGVSDQDIVES